MRPSARPAQFHQVVAAEPRHDGVEFVEDQTDEFALSQVSAANENELRWCTTKDQFVEEIEILRHEYTALRDSDGADFLVTRRVPPRQRRGVDRVMSAIRQSATESGGKVCVDEELHAAVRTCSVLSFTALAAN